MNFGGDRTVNRMEGFIAIKLMTEVMNNWTKTAIDLADGDHAHRLRIKCFPVNSQIKLLKCFRNSFCIYILYTFKSNNIYVK